MIKTHKSSSDVTQNNERLVVYWSRRDFRLSDNPALHKAVEFASDLKCPVLPLFILEDYMVSGNPKYQFGHPSREFISRSLPHFVGQFSDFLIFQGKVKETFTKISSQFDIHIFVNEDVHPDFYKQIDSLRKIGLKVNLFKDQMTVDKNTLTGAGNIYSVFTPFKNSVLDNFISEKPLAKVDSSSIKPLSTFGKTYSEKIKNLSKDCIKKSDINYENIIKRFSNTRLLNVGKHQIDLDKYIERPDLSSWYYTEEDALKLFTKYVKDRKVSEYKNTRDSLDIDADEGKGTSKMSVGLAWGLISARQMISIIKKHYKDMDGSSGMDIGTSTYISELIWREFYKYLLYHHKELINTEFQEKYRGSIDWVKDNVAYERFIKWIKGETGYEIVDASMKQIEKTGWMHNRSRMIVASILSKNLGVDWRWGQEYFRATLIDIDEASNNGGWQWAASVGADPKPIRIFNPYLQQENYDPDKKYINKWLGKNEEILKSQNIPIIEHAKAREEALERYKLRGIKPRDY
jgi:deoxyribodipyrimidine photo-lyase